MLACTEFPSQAAELLQSPSRQHFRRPSRMQGLAYSSAFLLCWSLRHHFCFAGGRHSLEGCAAALGVWPLSCTCPILSLDSADPVATAAPSSLLLWPPRWHVGGDAVLLGLHGLRHASAFKLPGLSIYVATCCRCSLVSVPTQDGEELMLQQCA